MVVATHRDAEQHPVEAGAPGVVGEPLHREPLPRRGVEPPPDAGAGHPAAEPVEVVVGEAEPTPARLAAREVEDVGGRHPAAAQLEQHAGQAQQRVGAGERPVGEPDPQQVGGVADGVRPLGGREPEPGRDQWREGLDVRAHHEDVARLERRVVLEQPDQHLAQHVDLAGRAVARVHLQAPVAVGGCRCARSWTVGAWLARRSCWSQPSSVAGSSGGSPGRRPRGSRRCAACGAARGRRGRARRAAGARPGRRSRRRRGPPRRRGRLSASHSWGEGCGR